MSVLCDFRLSPAVPLILGHCLLVVYTEGIIGSVYSFLYQMMHTYLLNRGFDINYLIDDLL